MANTLGTNKPSTRYKGKQCEFCGYDSHAQQSCPARNSTCGKCGKSGHWSRVCKSGARFPNRYQARDNTRSIVNNVFEQEPTSQLNGSYLCALSDSTPSSLSNATVRAKVNDIPAFVLIDTGSSESFISKQFVSKLNL